MPGLAACTRLATPSGHPDGATLSTHHLGLALPTDYAAGRRLDWLSTVGPGAGCQKGLVDVSETYTAVYERDGNAWVVEIAEEPCVRCLCPNLAEARESIRHALARWLKTDSAELRIVDDFRLPAQIRTVQQSVKATRTEHERTQMMASMTDSRSAISWAEDLSLSMRDPVTVEALKKLGNRQISIDTFCHTITMAEELSRLMATKERNAPQGVFEND
jgi:hypothetical protein